FLSACVTVAWMLGIAASACAQEEIGAVVAAVQAAYNAYNQIEQLLASNRPSPSDQILAMLGNLDSQMAQLKGELDALHEEIKAVVYLVGQTAYLQRVSDILTAQGQAHDAYEEIMEWVQTNKTNAFLLNTAMADSLHAA